jgi:hypothetical protein
LALLWIFLAVVIAESLLSVTWNPLYFRWGIPIYVRKIKRQNYADIIPRAHDIEAAIPKGGRWTDFLVCNLDSREFAFREKLWEYSKSGLRYSPVMRGVLRFDPVMNQVTVIGHLNWFLALLVLIALVAFAPQEDKVFFLFVLLFLGGYMFSFFWIQRSRFDKVVEVAASQ